MLKPETIICGKYTECQLNYLENTHNTVTRALTTHFKEEKECMLYLAL